MNGKVVTIHLEHIGVRVYISQFERTKFLNVVIKFLTAKSNLVRQELVLEAINSISLCKSGCHPRRELINIERELEQANIDIENHQFSDLYSSDTEDDEIDYDDYVNKDEDEDYDEDDAYNNDSPPKLRKIRGNLNSNSRNKNDNQRRKRNRKKLSITSTTTTKAPKMDKKNLRFIYPTLEKRKKFFNDIADIDDSTDLNINRLQIINDCYNSKLIGYYRLACLYDTMIKGTTSTYPFFFAASFDEPRLMNLNKQKFLNNSKSSNYSSSSTLLLPSNMFLIIIHGIIINAVIFIICN